MNKVLAVAVHPDDETLGCGGTLLKHNARKDETFWLIATSMQEKYGFEREDISQRKKEIKAVAEEYGFEKVIQMDIPAGKTDQFGTDALVKKISKIFQKIKPNVIYLPFRADVHSDHRVIFEAAYSCTKIFRYPFVKKIVMMETISETEFSPGLRDDIFVPNYFIDISDYIEKKLDIMKIYKGEISAPPFPRSLENIRSLAFFRGAASGVKYAEAFMILKKIW